MKKTLLRNSCMVVAMGAVLCFLILRIIAGFFWDKETYFPQEGVWYCDELKMQLAFDDTAECFIIENETPICCSWVIDPGSSCIIVLCDEYYNDYYIGKELFTGLYVDSNSDFFIVREYYGTSEYRFDRKT